MKRPRRRPPKRMKDGELSVSYGYTREQGEDVYFTNGPGCPSPDARLLHFFFEHVKPVSVLTGQEDLPLLKELERRGYDLKTLRFAIQKIKFEPKTT